MRNLTRTKVDGFGCEESELIAEVVSDIWFEPVHPGESTSLRISVSHAEIPHGSCLSNLELLSVELTGSDGAAGYITFEYVGTFKGRAVFEAKQLHPASERDRLSGPLSSLFSSFLLAKT